MAARSKQLAFGTYSGPVSTPTTVYEVPGLLTTIVKSAALFNNGGVATTLQLLVNGDGADPQVRVFAETVQPNRGVIVQPHLVLKTGDQLQVSMGSGGTSFDFLISGTQLVT